MLVSNLILNFVPGDHPQMTTRLTLILLSCAISVMARVTTPEVVPEPGTLVMLGLGIAGMALYARKRTKR